MPQPLREGLSDPRQSIRPNREGKETKLVEAAGVEPASEEPQPQETTCVVAVLNSPLFGYSHKPDEPLFQFVSSCGPGKPAGPACYRDIQSDRTDNNQVDAPLLSSEGQFRIGSYLFPQVFNEPLWDLGMPPETS